VLRGAEGHLALAEWEAVVSDWRGDGTPNAESLVRRKKAEKF